MRIGGRKPSILFLHLIAIIVASLGVFPLIYIFSFSFKSLQEIYTHGPSLFPRHPVWDNYLYILKGLGEYGGQTGGANRLLVLYRNTILVTLSTVALVSIITSLAGYALARFKFRGRDFLFFLLVVLTFFPIGGSFLAQYELMHQLHLRNSFLGLILLHSAGFGIPLFFMRQVFLHIPSELEEAARIDGASDFRIFYQIMLPLATGGLVLAVVMIFIRVWGDNWLCYLMIDSAEKMTLGAGMWNLAPITPAAAGVSREAVASTFLTFFMLPSILLFAGLQRWFIRGAMEGLKL